MVASKPKETPDDIKTARMLLFLGEQPRDIAKRMKIPVAVVREELKMLVKHGIGDMVNGEFQPKSYLTSPQAELVSCVKQRRLRVLVKQGRIKANRITSRLQLIDTESLHDFLQQPRKAGFAGQKMIHGRTFVHPSTVARMKREEEEQKAARKKARRAKA
jgi:hypothetical protein